MSTCLSAPIYAPTVISPVPCFKNYAPGQASCSKFAVAPNKTQYITKYIPGKGTYRVAFECPPGPDMGPPAPPYRLQFSTRRFYCPCVSTRP